MSANTSIAGRTESDVCGPTRLIVQSVLLESVRRREFYVVLLFMGLFLVGALVARFVKIENAATATFLLNLGLTLAFAFAHLITLLTAARQFPDELDQRTIYPLLAKPVTRSQYITGKWQAAVLIGLGTMLLLLLAAWIPVPKLAEYNFGTFLQMLILQALSITMLGAIAIMLSLIIPKMLNITVLTILVLLGGKLTGLLKSGFADSPLHSTISWLVGYIPDFSRLEIITVYTASLPPLSFTDFMARLLCAAIFTVFPLLLAVYLLERKPL